MNTRTTITIDGADHELDDAFLEHVLSTAVEGGCSHWADVAADSAEGAGGGNIRDYDLSDYVEDDNDENGDDSGTYASANFVVSDDPTQGGTLDLQGIADAIERIASGEAEVPPAIREIILAAVRNGDATDIDAEAADCIVQVGLFDEVVYR